LTGSSCPAQNNELFLCSKKQETWPTSFQTNFKIQILLFKVLIVVVLVSAEALRQFLKWVQYRRATPQVEEGRA
jgi:hypothetical protein